MFLAPRCSSVAEEGFAGLGKSRIFAVLKVESLAQLV